MKLNSIITIFSFKSSLIILFLFFFIISITCKKQKVEWKGKIEDENGTTVIKNPKEPLYSEDIFELEEELSIGEAEGREEYKFSLISSIAVDNEERIYILDRKETNVRVFDKNCEYLRTIGRRGQGPGEIGVANSMCMTNKNEIIVEDPNNRRLIFYSLEGKFLKNVSTAKRLIMNLKVDSKGNIMGVFIDYERQGYTLGKFDSELNFLYSIGSSPLPDPQVFNPFFSILQWCITSDDHVVFGYPEKYMLKILDPKGKLVKKIYKEYDPIEITKEDIEETTRNFPPVIKSRKMDTPRYKPVYQWLTTDDENRIFVQTWQETKDREGYYYDVFDSDGRYIAKIPFKFRPRIWKKNKLYFIEKDKEGFQIVKRYKITWRR